jgi:hypothetical protein
MTHTPGPWEIEQIGVATTINGNGGIVAEVYSDTGNQQEEDANARLIAAAPDMLEALKALEEVSQQLAWVSHLASVPERRNEYLAEASKADEMNDRAVDMRRAAIAKAEGKD